MIVCFHRDIGDIGAEFEFPKPFYDEKHYYTAHDIAVEDEDVPEEYWIHDKPYMLAEEAPRPLQIHKIAQTAEGMGQIILASQNLMRYSRFMGDFQLKPHTMVVGAESQKDGNQGIQIIQS